MICRVHAWSLSFYHDRIIPICSSESTILRGFVVAEHPQVDPLLRIDRLIDPISNNRMPLMFIAVCVYMHGCHCWIHSLPMHERMVSFKKDISVSVSVEHLILILSAVDTGGSGTCCGCSEIFISACNVLDSQFIRSDLSQFRIIMINQSLIHVNIYFFEFLCTERHLFCSVHDPSKNDLRFRSRLRVWFSRCMGVNLSATSYFEGFNVSVHSLGLRPARYRRILEIPRVFSSISYGFRIMKRFWL